MVTLHSNSAQVVTSLIPSGIRDVTTL